MMGAKAELERELGFCKGRIQALEEQLQTVQAEKAGLFQQIEKLQDSLISVRAPDAYRDQQLEREGPLPRPSAELIERNRIHQEFTTGYLNAIEGPLLRDGNDIDDLIKAGIVRDHSTVPDSLHGNDES
ncbi:MAG: hypothetical protein NWE76_01855 [Candidatus Bathyarchaeota archaeon]|nr:hypothetical protein [Candidatus Bathyarchaeota archaeon]